jgi:hypothetical protein
VQGNGGRPEQARERVEEAQLFIEAAYACYEKMSTLECPHEREATSPLDSPEISVKLFVADPSGVRLEELIPVFHRWIKQDLLEDELAIDVASYEHVPKGPGIVLICDKAHYYFDMRAGRAGLRYRGRREARTERRRGGDGCSTRARSTRRGSWRPIRCSRAGTASGRTSWSSASTTGSSRPATPRRWRRSGRELEGAVCGLWGTDDVELELSSGPRSPSWWP